MKKLIDFMIERGIKASVAKGIIVGVFICVVAGVSIPIGITLNNRVEIIKDNDSFELGEKNTLIVSDYLKGNIKKAQIDTSNVDFTCAGDYIATISLKKDTYDIHVTIKDTIAPTFELIGDSYNAEINSPVNASDVITSIADASNNLTITIGDSVEGDASNTLSTYGANNNPSIMFDEENDYETEITVSDPSGNETTKKLLICVYNLPIITKAESTEFVVGDTDAYSNYKANITATDSRGEDITAFLSIDDRNVDISSVGSYKLFVTAIDKNGFETKVETEIIVKENSNVVTQTSNNINSSNDDSMSQGNIVYDSDGGYVPVNEYGVYDGMYHINGFMFDASGFRPEAPYFQLMKKICMAGYHNVILDPRDKDITGGHDLYHVMITKEEYNSFDKWGKDAEEKYFIPQVGSQYPGYFWGFYGEGYCVIDEGTGEWNYSFECYPCF